MAGVSTRPRILFVTPDVAHLPAGMGKVSGYNSARAGGVSDFSAKEDEWRQNRDG